jgi:hypothetical protein
LLSAREDGAQQVDYFPFVDLYVDVFEDLDGAVVGVYVAEL